MPDSPLRGAFPHQHRDPRGLVERIEAQIRERLQEALEMAGLKLLVELRARHGRPAPVDSNEVDRREFASLTADILTHVSAAFREQLAEQDRRDLDRAESGAQSERERLLAGQVLLARRLPDYWQRLETYQTAYAKARLEAPAPRGWLGRLLGNP
jgi:hypothetical protein